jgi:hypothetical protein
LGHKISAVDRRQQTHIFGNVPRRRDRFGEILRKTGETPRLPRRGRLCVRRRGPADVEKRQHVLRNSGISGSIFVVAKMILKRTFSTWGIFFNYHASTIL